MPKSSPRSLFFVAVTVVASGCADAQSTAPSPSGEASSVSIDFHQPNPIPIPEPTPIIHPPATDLSLGADGHGCIRGGDGTVWCWGNNTSGQLGDGTMTSRTSPAKVPGISNAVRVAAGGGASCAVLADGSVECWGNYLFGKTIVQTTAPTPVPNLSNATAIAAGDKHFCAIYAPSGAVVCWGYNASGQLGVSSATAPSASGLVYVNVSGAVALAAGSEHTCALTQAGSVVCWGSNRAQQLALPTSNDINVPPTAVPLSNVRQVSASAYSTCAVGLNGSVTCFGANFYCSDGPGTTCDWPVGQTTIGGLGYAIAVAVSYDHACAQMSDYSVRCWGVSNALGDGETTLAFGLGGVVKRAQGATMIAGGVRGATCDILGNDVQCWGQSDDLTVSSTPASIY